MHTLNLIVKLVKVNVQQDLAYRTDALVNILVNLLWLAWELLGLSILFRNTPTLVGWGPGDLLALLGVFRLVNTLMAALIWPNTEKFNAGVRDGSLDYTLLRPAPALFLVTFTRIIVWRAWDVVLGAVLIGIGLRIGGGSVSAVDLGTFLLLAASGAVILYSLWVAMIAVTFWFVKFDNNVTILQALLEAGRYPASVYPAWLRVIVTFIVPIAVATTVPLQALRGELTPGQVLLFLGIGATSLWIASRIWKAGLRRYGGASA